MAEQQFDEATMAALEAAHQVTTERVLRERGIDPNNVQTVMGQGSAPQAQSASSPAGVRTLHIRHRVGPRVAEYIIERDVWQKSLNEHATNVMSDEEFNATGTVRGLFKRTTAVVATGLPWDLSKIIKSLERDIALR